MRRKVWYFVLDDRGIVDHALSLTGPVYRPLAYFATLSQALWYQRRYGAPTYLALDIQ